MKKIVISFILVIVVVLCAFSVNAFDSSGADITGSAGSSSFLDNIFNQASGFTGSGNYAVADAIKTFARENIVPTIAAIGNLIIAGVTVILGVKYIWSAAQGKAEVSESLPTYVIGVVFFFLGDVLVKWIYSSASGVLDANNWGTVQSSIWATLALIVRMLAFAGVIFLGLKYMFASAEGKAATKANLGIWILGLVFVFAASGVIEFIVKLGNDIL